MPCCCTFPCVPLAGKGKTLAEIEADEGGPVRESMVGMAHAKRAMARKKGKGGETYGECHQQ